MRKPYDCIWVVVKIMVLFWVLIIVRHLIFRVPKKGPLEGAGDLVSRL